MKVEEPRKEKIMRQRRRKKGVEGQEMTQTPREKEQEKDGRGKPGKKTTG